jgi:hypothetical protein
MATGILIDEETLVLNSGGKLTRVPVAELASKLTEPTVVAIVPCDIRRIAAASEQGIERVAAEQLGAGVVFCYEKLDGPNYQVFAMPEALLRKLREATQISAVVPYAVAVRAGENDAKRTGLGQIITKVVKLGDQGGTVQRAILDAAGKQGVMTVTQGNEIKVVRVLEFDDDIDREVLVTLKGVGMPDCPVLTPSRGAFQHLQDAGHEVELVQVAADAPSVGLLGLRKPPALRFYLPAELAELRRLAVRRKLWQSTALSVVSAIVGIAVLAIAYVHETDLEGTVQQLTMQRGQRELELANLYRERYASMASEHSFDLPQAWAELVFMLPPQLEVRQVVRTTNNTLRAELVRREAEGDDVAHDPPMSIGQLRQALDRSPIWKGGRVELMFESHELNYAVEKRL